MIPTLIIILVLILPPLFPLNRREDINSLSKVKKGWANARHQKPSSSSSSKKGGGGKTAAGFTAPAGQPRSPMEFERDWRRMGPDMEKRLR